MAVGAAIAVVGSTAFTACEYVRIASLFHLAGDDVYHTSHQMWKADVVACLLHHLHQGALAAPVEGFRFSVKLLPTAEVTRHQLRQVHQSHSSCQHAHVSLFGMTYSTESPHERATLLPNTDIHRVRARSPKCR